MSIFESIKNAIFGHAASAAPAAAPAAASSPAPVVQTAKPAATATTGSAEASLSSQALHEQLAGLSAKSPQKLNWQTSIVDLMKLVKLDPSLANRKQLATELGYQGDTNDSATMNIWLHKAVMEKLAEDGGKSGAGLH